MGILGGDIGYSNEKGKVIASRNILLSVINLATKEINGVAELVSGRLAPKSYDGVKVNFFPDGIEINIFIKVFDDVAVPELASKIQENVKNGVAGLIDIDVKTININVLGVELNKNKEDTGEF